MAANISVSKGVFVYKNDFKKAAKKSRRKSKPTTDVVFINQPWYWTYKSLWTKIESRIETLNNEMFSNVLTNLVTYVKQSYSNIETEIPTAALLTGINMPDHLVQFRTLTNEIKTHVTPHVATLRSEDCSSMKYLVETMINQLVNDGTSDNEIDDDSDLENYSKVKKSQCNFTFLQSWYEELYLSTNVNSSPSKKTKTKQNRHVIVIIIPDFESFLIKVLQDFILICSSYLNIIPFVFVFGIATSLTTVHRQLPYHVSSKVRIQVFNSPPSITNLNNILENVLFTNDCPFHLGGKVFNLFTDIFLFYDLSVSGFIQNFKYAMIEHFSYGNAMSLCQAHEDTKDIVSKFSKDDCENVRRLLSFRKLVEDNEEPELRIRLLCNDNYLKLILVTEIEKIREYLGTLHLFIRCLFILVGDLPKAPLGKQIREIYSFVVSRNIFHTQEYKDCVQLLGFQSKDELLIKLNRIITYLINNCEQANDKESEVGLIVDKLSKYVGKINDLDQDNEEEEVKAEDNDNISGAMDRAQLKEKLLQMSKQAKPLNKYEKLRFKLLTYLTNIFELFLIEPTSFYFHEIFFFNDISVQSHIIGSHRAAIHTALNDPHYYLQCGCCDIPSETSIIQSMPDICIVYKLHLECGKMINLYDWLQAYLSIVDPQDEADDSKRKVDTILQARFTQAVAELEFLGFIKSSRRKTDHVARLTWGG